MRIKRNIKYLYLVLSIIQLQFIQLLNCFARSNGGSDIFISFSPSAAQIANLKPANTYMTLLLSDTLGMVFTKVTSITYTNYLSVPPVFFTQPITGSTMSGSVISIPNPYVNNNAAGYFFYSTTSTYLLPSVITISFQCTFAYSGSFTITPYSSTSQYGTGSFPISPSSLPQTVDPDIITDTDIVFNFKSSTPSKIALQTGQFTLSIKTPLPKANINKIELILPNTWYPDSVLDNSCATQMQTNPASFSSTKLGTLTASQSLSAGTNNVIITLTFSALDLNADTVDLNFSMTNPYSTQNIINQGYLQTQASFYSTSKLAFYTNMVATSINAQSATFADCTTKGVPSISCSDTSTGTYSLSNCLAGMSKFVNILLKPMIFQEIYSSVKLTISNIPNQPAISGISFSVQNYAPDLSFAVTSTASASSHDIFFGKYLDGTNSGPLGIKYMCMDNANYLSITIPGLVLPYDSDGLNISAEFYTQPYIVQASYVDYVRNTDITTKLANAQCGSTQLAISKNILLSAAVTTSDSNSLQVGATAATHKIKIVSKYNFYTTGGKIITTLPSTLSINSAGTFTCTANLIKTADDTEFSVTVTSCTYTGQVVTLSYTDAGTTQVKGFTYTINQIKNPVTIQFSGVFSVETHLRNGGISDVSDPGLTTFGFTTQPAPFQTTNLVNGSVSTKTVYIIQTYTLTLVSPVAFTSGDTITVNFPIFITSIDTIIISQPSSGLSVTSATNAVPLILTFSSSLAPLTNIQIQFNIRNPPVPNKDYTYSVIAKTSTGTAFLQSNILYGSADTITKTGFSQLTISPDNTVNLFATAKYSVSFTTTVILENPSYLYLTFTAPTATHNFFTSGTTTCTAVTVGLIVTCTPNSPSNNQITVRFSISIQPATNYQFTINNVLNYMSLAPFVIKGQIGYTTSQIGNESSQNQANTNVVTLSNASLVIQNTNLGESSQYIFTIDNVLPAPVLGGITITSTNLVTFSVPSTVTVNVPTCSGTYSTSQLDLPCFPAQNPSTITVQNVNNPIKLIQATTTPFSIILYETVSTVNYPIKQYVNAALVYTNPCDISSFCKTCLVANTKNCQSCYKSNTIEYFSSTTKIVETILDQTTAVQTCVSTCPNGTFQKTNAGSEVCQACDSTCFSCNVSATTCTACTGLRNLDSTNNTCVTTCPTNYYGASNKCVLCSTTGNCQTCSAAGVCITCVTGFKKQGTSCVATCDPGYYEINSGTECTACPTGCALCTSSLNCTSCQPSYYQYLTSCVSTCPIGYSKILSSGVYICGLCDPKCKACQTLSTQCTSCYSDTYLFQQDCIVESLIPGGYYGDKSTWTVQKCMDYCSKCSYKTLCTTCDSSAVIYKGICYTSCPEEAPVSDGVGGCKVQYVPAAVSDSSSKVVPFPMLLSCIAFCISVYFSKYEKPQTFVPGCVVGFCAFFEWISWIILIAIAYLNDGLMNITTLVAIVGFVSIYLFNILYFIYYKRIIAIDSAFIEWGLSHKNKICKRFCIVFALIFSFKIQKIIFCKYFNQVFFKVNILDLIASINFFSPFQMQAKLKDIDLFSPFNKISILSVFFNSFLIIFSAAVFSYRYQTETQLFILSLDTLLVTMFMLIFMIWEALKNDTFFEETYNLNFEQMSQFTQRFFPFDQSYMERAKQRSVYGHLKKSDSNSSLMEFGRDNKVTKVEQLQQPLNQVMDPNDISTNAALDRNVLNNANNGAPYLIQDEISESSKPGKKRQFERKHIAPVFDYNNFPPIEENSLEDEEEDYYDDDIQNQTMKKMYNKQNTRIQEDQEVGAGLDHSNQHNRMNKNNKVISLEDQEDLENQKNINNKNSKRRDSLLKNDQSDFDNTNYYGSSQSNGFNKHNDSSEPIPGKQNQNHTVYYDPQDPSGQMNNVSMGVGLQEDDHEGEEIRQRLFSKQSLEENSKDQSALMAGTAGAIAGATIASTNKDEKNVDKNGNKIDKDGNIIDKDGNKTDKNGNRFDKDGNRIDKDGNKIDEDGNRIDQNGNKIDKEGNIIDKDGNKIDKNGNKIDKDGNVIDKEGNKTDKNGNRFDKDGNRIDKNGNKIDKDGNIIDKDGNKIDKDGNKTDKNGNRFDKDGNRIDKDGNRIDKDGNRIDKDGNRIDKDGNKIDKNGNKIDKDGNIIDKDGNKTDKNGNRFDKNGNKIDKDGNRIDKDGNIIDKDGNKIDKNGNKIDKDGNIIDKDGNKTDKNGNRFDKEGNRIDKDGNRIDKDGNRIDKNGNKIDKNGNIINKDGKIVDKDGKVIEDKNKKSPTAKTVKPDDDLMFYFDKPLNENANDKKKNEKKGDENNKVEKIMPEIEDLDDDLNQKDKLQNEKGKNMKMITPNDLQKGNNKNNKGPQKNNLFGTSEDDEANEGDASNKKKKGKSDKKNNIYDSDDSLHTASEAEMNFNEVSPSDFNILNQRYEEDYFVQPPQSALQMQLLQQSMSKLNKNYSTSQSQANMMNNTNYDNQNPRYQQAQAGQYSSGIMGQGIDNNRNMSQSGQNNLGGVNPIQQNGQRYPPLHSSNSNASMNSLNTSNVRKKSNSPVKRQRQIGMNNSRSQNTNALSVDVKQNTLPNNTIGSNNQSSLNSNNYNNNGNPNSILPNGNPGNQLIIENFEDFNNNTSSQSGFQGVNGPNQLNQSFNNQDPRMSYTQMNRGNMSSRSKGNSPSNSNITYKVPAVDVNKLKNLEKIYLQRIEANVHSSQSSRKNALKKKKKKIQRELSQNSNLQIHHAQGMKSPGDMSEIYFGEKGKKFDPSILDHNGEEVIDFEDDDDDIGPENVNFDQNF